MSQIIIYTIIILVAIGSAAAIILYFVAQRFKVFEDPRIDPEGTDSWVTLNLLASWQATDTAAVGLKLQNLSDRSYREHGSGIDAAGRNLGAWVSLAF